MNNETDKVTLAVGRKVVNVLRDHDFEVEWNESVNSKILLPNFRWQYIYEENKRDLLNYNHTVKLMSKNEKNFKTEHNPEIFTKIEDNNGIDFWLKLRKLWS